MLRKSELGKIDIHVLRAHDYPMRSFSFAAMAALIAGMASCDRRATKHQSSEGKTAEERQSDYQTGAEEAEEGKPTKHRSPEEKTEAEKRRERLFEAAKRSTETLREIRDRPLEERADPRSAFGPKENGE